ncbi:MAG: RNA polymerase sigma factor [Phycisphaerales bacterium]
MTPAIHHDSKGVFEILVREHADMLAAFIRTLVRDPGTADDVFQETIIVAWRRLGDFDRSRPFAPWLRGIAANCAMAAFRAGKARPLSDDPAVMDSVNASFDRLGTRGGDTFRERISHMDECLSQLPEAMRECITLAYSRGMMLKEIAEATGQMEETIKKRVQRARQALADCILAREATP